MKYYFQAMRLGRWPRSLAIIIGSASFFFIHQKNVQISDFPEILIRITAAFLLTWAISTVNYLINEVADAPFDIHHPTKHKRPLVSGEIKKWGLLIIGVLLAGAGLFPAFFFFPRPFFYSLLGLLIAGFIYNVRPVRTKDIPFLDAVSESANNPIRFLIGWYAFAATVFPPISLLLCWWAFGNFLMISKRLSEFRVLKEKAADYRRSHRKYSHRSLLFGLILSSAIFFLLYFFVAAKLNLMYLFFLSPMVLIYLLLIFKKTITENSVLEEPEKLMGNLPFAFFTILLLLAFSLSFIFDKVSQ
ncbi:MAG: UbiA family prenyltransferase [Candidatus Aminicenantes bacterium]|nr:UbiA family prenyltransferase [Candidatus Aminicenantes bacterium]